MATWDELLEQNRNYSETQHTPQPYLSETANSPPPFFIVSCMDHRVSVEGLLGIKAEDAFIARNAGGRIKPCFTDLLFLDTFTQEQVLKHVIVIHHTNCGFTHKTDQQVKDELKALRAPNLAREIDQLHFGTFGSAEALEESVREDLKFLKDQPLIRQEIKDNAKGYVYDIKTGKLKQIS